MQLPVTASPCSFSKKTGQIMPLKQNPHHTVTCFGCIGFSMYACRFSVPQMWQFYLFTYPRRSKWASSENMIFFFLPKSASSVSRLQAHSRVVQPYSFGGRIKLIICKIRHELSVTIEKISISWKKNVRWRNQ